MKYLGYFLLGFIVFWIVDFLAINIGYGLGAGAFDIGLILAAISILSAIVVVCTCVIIAKINEVRDLLIKSKKLPDNNLD